ncbi:hypothetical protein D9758_008454 [Tetrapyrgos nigripes]|uniref:Uncharacterized protein n=1 Tax=Tetrapyrgos nigripes TaxID=182062 RepID=A0A8H5CP20_9AGAR|nr:hypothetical protein D9758_008454 [Tetrapyrgos nigripes]
MSHWTQYDEDPYRLPEGMRRTGYDTDTGKYKFVDRHGKVYESAPHEYYGEMKPASVSAPERVYVREDPAVINERLQGLFEPKKPARSSTLPSSSFGKDPEKESFSQSDDEGRSVQEKSRKTGSNLQAGLRSGLSRSKTLGRLGLAKLGKKSLSSPAEEEPGSPKSTVESFTSTTTLLRRYTRRATKERN